MNFELNEREAREVLEYRMRHEWFEKHKRLGKLMVWWLMVGGLILVALALIFREQIKAWTGGQAAAIGLPTMFFWFWPGLILYWTEFGYQGKARKQAKALFNQAGTAEVR